MASIDAAKTTFPGAWPQGCAQVTIEQGSDPDPTVSGFATPGTCVVYLTPTFLAQSPHPDVVCAVVVHEFGHLLGLDHSGDANDVMFPSPAIPPACATGAEAEPDLAETADAAAPMPTTSRRSTRTRVCAMASRRRARTRARSSTVRRRSCRRATRR